MTLDEYIGRMCPDTLVHTWDLARAAGVDDTLDPGAVSVVYAELHQRGRRRAARRPVATPMRSTPSPPQSSRTG